MHSPPVSYEPIHLLTILLESPSATSACSSEVLIYPGFRPPYLAWNPPIRPRTNFDTYADVERIIKAIASGFRQMRIKPRDCMLGISREDTNAPVV